MKDFSESSPSISSAISPGLGSGSRFCQSPVPNALLRVVDYFDSICFSSPPADAPIPTTGNEFLPVLCLRVPSGCVASAAGVRFGVDSWGVAFRLVGPFVSLARGLRRPRLPFLSEESPAADFFRAKWWLTY